MKTLIKSVVVIGSALALTASVVVGQNIGSFGYTGAPAPRVAQVTLTPNVVASVLTNNVNVVGVQLITPSGTGTASFFDSSSLASPYYGTNAVVASYVSTAGYNTNYVTSFVGYNGVTNTYTNTGYWTYYVTNAAATNVLSPKGMLPLIGGSVTSGNNPMSFRQGVTIWATTNTTAIITYIPNR